MNSQTESKAIGESLQKGNSHNEDKRQVHGETCDLIIIHWALSIINIYDLVSQSATTYDFFCSIL